MSHVPFSGGKVLTIPQIAKKADYTRRHMARLVQNGEFPFDPIDWDGKQKRYADTPKLRQWCSERRAAKAIRGKMARQTSKLYRGRHWNHLLAFKKSIQWMLQRGQLNDPGEIDHILSQIDFVVGEVRQRLVGTRDHLHRVAESHKAVLDLLNRL